VLKPPHHLTSIEYNSKDEYVLGGGMQNGQLAFFDTRRGTAPVELSSMWTSHKDPVCRMVWIVSKTGNECMSAATDGQVGTYSNWFLRRKISPFLILQSVSNVVQAQNAVCQNSWIVSEAALQRPYDDVTPLIATLKLQRNGPSSIQ